MLTRLAQSTAVVIAAALVLIVISQGSALAGGSPGGGGGFGFAQCGQSSSPSCSVTAGTGGTPGNPGTSGSGGAGGTSTASGSGTPDGTSTGGGAVAIAPGEGAPSGCPGTENKTFGCVPKGCTITVQTLACPIGIPGTAPAAKGKAKARPALPAPGVLAQLAERYLRLPSPQIRSSPAPAALQLTQLPVWLWVAPAAWQPQSKTASVPGESVTATASPSSAAWSMGNGATVTCTGPGTPYTAAADPAAASPTCGYTYLESSAGQPGGAYPVTVTITWAITWKGPGGTGGTLAPLQTAARSQFRVAESQALNTTSIGG